VLFRLAWLFHPGGRFLLALCAAVAIALRAGGSRMLLQAGSATNRPHVIELMARHADLLGEVGQAEGAARHRRRAELLRAIEERPER